MQAKILLNFILLLIILALTWFIVFVYQPENSKDIMPNFTNLDKNQVRHIHIIREQDEIKLEKIDDIWHIIQPLQLTANQFRIDSLLHLLHTKHYQALESVADLAILGLQPPQMQLLIDELHLDLGFKSPFNDNRRYVQQNGRVYLVIDTFSAFLSGDATLFASLSPLQNNIITGLKLPDLELNLHGVNWVVTPEQTNISADSIQNLLKNWQNFQALSVRPYQLSNSAQMVEIQLQNPPYNLKFELIDNEFEFILADPNAQVQYHIAAEQMGILLNLVALPAISM